ncbi:hypothetical protein [Flavobacterium chungangense]|uniref:Uncharacterized protein n=1 Tax=Flavobacterium chungangense TaxID=554283 RepID=A0A6V6YYY7_9FLAO|nr:hypothetical protein [Flavobacterium chungangense]CAD0004464.1 hypothetical protein FLACHUCJ7_01874 [Flavobacterium chungangense]
MNKLDVNQVGGFPMTTRILDELQKISAVFNGLGGIAGDKTILYGCNITGSTADDGVVYVNGEVFFFKGGIVQSKVIIKEDKENLVFENNESKTVIRTRYVTFGSGIGSIDWADFTKPKETKEIEEALEGKADQTSFEALSNAFAIVYTKMLTIETGAQKNLMEHYDYGQILTTNRDQGQDHGNFSKNYADIFPPSGYTMSNLKAFIPSINKIYFSGNVNGDDTLWCDYDLKIDRITVICNNSESRAASEVSYLAIWKK